MGSSARKSKPNSQASGNSTASASASEPSVSASLQANGIISPSPRPPKHCTTRCLLQPQLHHDARVEKISEQGEWRDLGDTEHATELCVKKFLEEARQGYEFSRLIEFLKEQQREAQHGDVFKHGRASDASYSGILDATRPGSNHCTNIAVQSSLKQAPELIEKVRSKSAAGSLGSCDLTRHPNGSGAEDERRYGTSSNSAVLSLPQCPQPDTFRPSTSTDASPSAPTRAPYHSTNLANFPTARLRNQALYLVYTQMIVPRTTQDHQRVHIDSVHTLRKTAMDRATEISLPLLPLDTRIDMSIHSAGQQGWRVARPDGSVVSVFVQDVTLNPEARVLEGLAGKPRMDGVDWHLCAFDDLERPGDFLGQPLGFASGG